MSACTARVAALQLGALLLVASLDVAAAAPGDAVVQSASSLRRSGCTDRPGILAPLRRDAAIDRLAARWSRQPDLAIALSESGYPARSVVSLRMSSSAAKHDIERSLRERLCAELLEPRYSAMGVAENAGYTWLVLAVPSRPPDSAAAPAIARDTLQRVNAARARPRRCGEKTYPAAAPLVLEPRLQAAAAAHASELAKDKRLSHEGRDGSSPADRATRAGYLWRAVGENVARGPETAAEVMEGWLASPHHCVNIMDPEFTQMGLAFALNRDSEQKVYWAQSFGRPR